MKWMFIIIFLFIFFSCSHINIQNTDELVHFIKTNQSSSISFNQIENSLGQPNQTITTEHDFVNWRYDDPTTKFPKIIVAGNNQNGIIQSITLLPSPTDTLLLLSSLKATCPSNDWVVTDIPQRIKDVIHGEKEMKSDKLKMSAIYQEYKNEIISITWQMNFDRTDSNPHQYH